jgi:hypothetical protein
VKFTLATSAGATIDEGKYTVPANLFVKSNITSFGVTPDDATAGTRPVGYTFTVIPKHRVAQGSYIFVTFPPEVTIHNNDASEMAR